MEVNGCELISWSLHIGCLLIGIVVIPGATVLLENIRAFRQACQDVDDFLELMSPLVKNLLKKPGSLSAKDLKQCAVDMTHRWDRINQSLKLIRHEKRKDLLKILRDFLAVWTDLMRWTDEIENRGENPTREGAQGCVDRLTKLSSMISELRAQLSELKMSGDQIYSFMPEIREYYRVIWSMFAQVARNILKYR